MFYTSIVKTSSLLHSLFICRSNDHTYVQHSSALLVPENVELQAASEIVGQKSTMTTHCLNQTHSDPSLSMRNIYSGTDEPSDMTVDQFTQHSEQLHLTNTAEVEHANAEADDIESPTTSSESRLSSQPKYSSSVETGRY